MYINRPHGQRGRGRILSSDARAFKEEVHHLTRSVLATTSFSPDPKARYGLIILMYTTRRNRDVSNIIKITEDAIFDAANVNDSHNSTIILKKIESDSDYCVVYFGYESRIMDKFDHVRACFDST